MPLSMKRYQPRPAEEDYIRVVFRHNPYSFDASHELLACPAITDDSARSACKYDAEAKAPIRKLNEATRECIAELQKHMAKDASVVMALLMDKVKKVAPAEFDIVVNGLYGKRFHRYLFQELRYVTFNYSSKVTRDDAALRDYVNVNETRVATLPRISVVAAADLVMAYRFQDCLAELKQRVVSNKKKVVLRGNGGINRHAFRDLIAETESLCEFPLSLISNTRLNSLFRSIRIPKEDDAYDVDGAVRSKSPSGVHRVRTPAKHDPTKKARAVAYATNFPELPVSPTRSSSKEDCPT